MDKPSEGAVQIVQGTEAAQRPWIAERVEQQSSPAPAPSDKETKKERRARLEREAVAALKARGAADHAAVLIARERFRVIEEEARKQGRGRPVQWEYTPQIAEDVLRLIMQAIPAADYSEYPGAPERPGACTQAGIPHWVFRRWMEEREELRTAVACAREIAADTLADRHLHLAQVALEWPAASDAVRVAAEILKWQAQLRNRRYYGDQQPEKVPLGHVVINIGTLPVARGEVIDITAESLKGNAQALEVKGETPG